MKGDVLDRMGDLLDESVGVLRQLRERKDELMTQAEVKGDVLDRMGDLLDESVGVLRQLRRAMGAGD